MNLPTITIQIPFFVLTRRDLPLCTPSDPHTHPLDIIHDALSQFCPDVPVLKWPPSTTPRSASAESPQRNSYSSKWSEISQSHAWVLRLAPSKDSDIGVLPGWRDSDATLSPDEKVHVRQSKPWTCALLLQRFNIPLRPSTSFFHAFAAETHKLCGILHMLDSWTGAVPRVSGAGRWFAVVAAERCWMGVSAVVASSTCRLGERGCAHRGGGYKREYECSGWEIEVLRKVLILVTAFEEQITMLSTPTAQMEFWSLSRFEEYRRVRALMRDPSKSGEKRGGVFSQEGEAAWDGILRANDVQLRKLIEQMMRFEDRGHRLSVSFSTECTRSSSPRCVSNVTLPSYRSTLCPVEIIAYTSLIASLLHLAYTIPLETLIFRVESFHKQCFAPLDGFGNFLSAVLDVPHGTTTFWMDFLAPYYVNGSAATTLTADDPPPLPPLHKDPFAPLQVHIRTTLAKEREYMPTFIDRYARVGGFASTSEAKVSDLLLAEERTQKRRNKGKEKD